MSLLTRILLAGAIALTFAAPACAQSVTVATTAASAPNERASAREVEIRARVVEIDKVGRTVTLRGVRGNVVTVDVPPTVKNLEQVSVGDFVTVRHLSAVIARLEPLSKKSGIRERIESTETTTAAEGGLPGMSEVHKVEVLAVVQSINRKAHQATLRGAKRTVTVDVPSDVDLTKVKVGDEVRAWFTEAVVISVERAVPASRAASAARAASASAASAPAKP